MGVLAAIAVGSLTLVAVAGQAPAAATKAKTTAVLQRTTAAAKTWVAPKTPWGEPDLQGIWSTNSSYFTDYERPKQFGTRTLLTDEEFQKRAKVQRDYEPQGGGVWHDAFREPASRATSLVVDPPDGRIPPFTPEAQKRVDARVAARRARGVAESWEDVGSMWSRCITRTMPGGMAPRGYNNNHQILQIPGYVVIVDEEIHDARIIPLDGRRHVDRNIRKYLGDPRGHWEGSTLVVESTNFTDKINFKGDPLEVNDLLVSKDMRLVERFTRTGPHTIDYQFTVEDPATFTKPWTVSIPMTKDDTQDELLEYACHEGNYSMATMLGGARAAEAEAEAEAARAAEAAKKK
jgi:hypothetical protein